MMQRFLPYLPSGTDPAAAEALDAIQEDLEWLLSADGPTFWGVLRADGSLRALLDSFLRYASRPFDERYREQPPTELAVRELVLAALHRGACRAEAGAPAAAERARLVTSLLDVPRLLDLCALYSATPGSAQLREIVQAMFRLQPNLGAELGAVGATVAGNLSQVVDACLAAAFQAPREPAMLQSVLDGVEYLRDVCLTLCALLSAYPPAAALLLSRGQGQLLEGLAALHDALLPAAAKLAERYGSAGGSGEGEEGAEAALGRLYRHCVHLELASERSVLLLLSHAYLEPADGGSGGGGVGPSSARHGGAGGGGGSSSGAGSSTSGARGAKGLGPIERGEALLSSVMLLGHREEQGGGCGSAGAARPGGLPLAQALAERHGLGGAVEAALLRHEVALDEAQSAYLAALLGVASLAEAPAPVAHVALADGGAGAGQAPLSAPAGGGAIIDTAVLASQISQIKDLLPDYGDGYLAVCLDAYDGSAERVIDALLGGSLYPQLADLDPALTLQQYQQQRSAAAADPKGKGKQKVGEPGPAALPPPAPARPAAAGGFPDCYAAAGAGRGPGIGISSTSSAGASAAPAAKPRPESKTAKYLDVREGSYRESLISAATATQWEYDDEYDDSFDDLISYTADGVTEVEGEAPSSHTASPIAPLPAGGIAGAQRGMQDLSLGGPARPVQQQQQQQAGGPPPQGGRGGRKAAGKLWVLDGRVYNYPKPGAVEVASREDAEKQLEAARQAAQEIHGLGPGGNRPLPPSGAQQWRQQAAAAAADGEQAGSGPGQQNYGGRSGGGGAGRGGSGPPGGTPPGGRGGGEPGRSDGGGGRGRGDHRYKDQHKAAIANHHRKDRALKKAMGGFSG